MMATVERWRGSGAQIRSRVGLGLWGGLRYAVAVLLSGLLYGAAIFGVGWVALKVFECLHMK